MRYLGLTASTLAAVLAVAAPAVAAEGEELSRGGMLSASCAGCHGTDGRSPGAIPTLSGRSEEYLRTALLDFRSGERPATVMGRHAKAYSDEDIRLIAEYLAGRQWGVTQ